MAKQKEDSILEKVQLVCINKELHVYEVTDLMPDAIVICEVEKEEIEFHKARKIDVLVPIVQTREITGGLLSAVTFNSEGYCEGLKLTIIGVKPKA